MFAKIAKIKEQAKVTAHKIRKAPPCLHRDAFLYPLRMSSHHSLAPPTIFSTSSSVALKKRFSLLSERCCEVGIILPRLCGMISPSLSADISARARRYLRPRPQISPPVAFHTLTNPPMGCEPLFINTKGINLLRTEHMSCDCL